MERQMLQVHSPGSFTHVGLLFSHLKTWKGDVQRGLLQTCSAKALWGHQWHPAVGCTAAGTSAHSKVGKTDTGQRMRHWGRASPPQMWMCVTNTCPKASTASACSVSVSLGSYLLLTGIHVPTPPDSWSIKNKWELGVNLLHIPRIPGRRARAELHGLAISPQSASLHRQDVGVQPASPPLRLDKTRAMVDTSAALG